MINYRSNKG